MRRLPWHIAVRVDKRAVMTALGVALGVAFTAVSLAVPEGLRTESIDPSGPFGRQDTLVFATDLAPFEPVAAGLPDATLARVAAIPLQGGREAILVAYEGPRAPPLTPGLAYPAAGARDLPAQLVPAATAEPIPWGQSLDAPLLSRGWIAVAPETLSALRPDLDGKASYLLAGPLDAATAQEIAARGFRVEPAPAIEPFFRASAGEIARDLLLVVLFTLALVALFTYEFLRAEVRDRRREIGIWRAVGMEPRDVLALLLGRALAITAAGVLVGAGLATLTLAAAARVSGAALFTPSLAPAALAVLALAFLAVGGLGALIPALSAARGQVRAQLEAAP